MDIMLNSIMKPKLSLLLFCCTLVTATMLIPSVSKACANDASNYAEVDISYLSEHVAEFQGKLIKTRGTVEFLLSFYMFEDFWLSRVLPVVLTTPPMPPENSCIEVVGIIMYSDLEGGFYYLLAYSWQFAEETAPEFHHLALAFLFVAATSVAALMCKKKRQFC